jgi:hypothetical protein
VARSRRAEARAPGLRRRPAAAGERAAGVLPRRAHALDPGQNALVAGDSLPDGGATPDAWLESEWAKATREEYNEKLCPLLDLPVEMLLATHGDPVLDDAQNALKRALS